MKFQIVNVAQLQEVAKSHTLLQKDLNVIVKRLIGFLVLDTTGNAVISMIMDVMAVGVASAARETAMDIERLEAEHKGNRNL